MDIVKVKEELLADLQSITGEWIEELEALQTCYLFNGYDELERIRGEISYWMEKYENYINPQEVK